MCIRDRGNLTGLSIQLGGTSLLIVVGVALDTTRALDSFMTCLLYTSMARLKEQYVNEIAPALNSKFGYKSVMQIPKLDKRCV